MKELFKSLKKALAFWIITHQDLIETCTKIYCRTLAYIKMRLYCPTLPYQLVKLFLYKI